MISIHKTIEDDMVVLDKIEEGCWISAIHPNEEELAFLEEETGIDLDADVTGELLINIFIPNTPLHDGAVIIREDKIAVAAAYLPLTESNLIPKELGTRHRAAVGISEVTDALTIVVSEETGGVTLTKNNELMRDLTREDYLKYLNSHLITQEEDKVSLLQEFVDGFKKGGHK